jgi:hypothetical protein
VSFRPPRDVRLGAVLGSDQVPDTMAIELARGLLNVTGKAAPWAQKVVVAFPPTYTDRCFASLVGCGGAQLPPGTHGIPRGRDGEIRVHVGPAAATVVLSGSILVEEQINDIADAVRTLLGEAATPVPVSGEHRGAVHAPEAPEFGPSAPVEETAPAADLSGTGQQVPPVPEPRVMFEVDRYADAAPIPGEAPVAPALPSAWSAPVGNGHRCQPDRAGATGGPPAPADEAIPETAPVAIPDPVSESSETDPSSSRCASPSPGSSHGRAPPADRRSRTRPRGGAHVG